jgi:hypothetical protein
MNLEKLKEKLGDETFAELKAHVEDLTGQRDAAKRESIDGRTGLKAEVEALRGLKAKLFDKLGLDDDADLDALPDAKGQAEAVRQFEAKFKRLERELGEKSKSFNDLTAKHRANLRDVAISKALNGQEFIHREAAEALIERRVEWDGDEIFYKTDKGMIPLGDGVKLFAEQNPALLKAAGTAGSGHRQTGGAGGKSMTRVEFEALPPQQRVEAAKAGIQLT